MRARRRLCALLGVLLCGVPWMEGLALAQPQVQFPWVHTLAQRRINGGNTYNCGSTHKQVGPGSNPGAWDYYAIDFDLNFPDAVATTADGMIVTKGDDGDLGFYVVVDHGGFYSAYAHLQNPAIIAVGKAVRSGERIGDAGHTGNTGGQDHLHFQLGRGTSPTPSSVTADAPEPMAGLNLSNNSIGQTGFGAWCQGFSPYWRSSHPLGDVLVYNPGTPLGNESVLKSRGSESGTFNGNFDRSSGVWGTAWNVIIPGQYDDDQDTDAWLWGATQSNPGSIVEMADGGGGWVPKPATNFDAGWTYVEPGDFNADGRTDLWFFTGGVANPYNNLVAFADGDGTWTVGGGSAMETSVIAYLGDFNGDRKTDVFVYNSVAASGRVYRANGSGGWDPGPYQNFSTPGYLVYPGFFDDDSYEDIMLVLQPLPGSNATYRIRFGRPDGTFVTKSDPPAGTLPGDRDEFIGYFDGTDPTNTTEIGKLKRADVLLYSYETGDYSVRLSDGNGLLSGTENGTWARFDSLFPTYENSDPMTDVLRYNGTRFQVMFRQPGATGWTGGTSDSCCQNYQVYPGFYDGK